MGTLPRVVVTGIGAETALGHGVSALWEGALLGLSAIRPVTRFDTRRFHARQAALIDRERGPDGAELETLFARDAADEALASCPDFGGGRAGIAVGTTLAGNGGLTGGAPRGERAGGAAARSRGDPGALSRALARRHGARGPVSTVSVACASGAAAVGLAAEWIREGHATCVLAGGADAISPFVFSGFDALRALSMSVARPFDVARDGLPLGEGAGFLLLEEEDQAARRGAAILARAAGSGAPRPRPDTRSRARIRRYGSSPALRSRPRGRSPSRCRPRPHSGARTQPSSWSAHEAGLHRLGGARGRSRERRAGRRESPAPDGPLRADGLSRRNARLQGVGRPSSAGARRARRCRRRHAARLPSGDHGARRAPRGGRARRGPRSLGLRGHRSPQRERRARQGARPRWRFRDDRLGAHGRPRGPDSRRAPRRLERRGPRARRRGRGRRRRDA